MVFDISKDYIGIFSPSSYISEENLAGGVKELEKFGFKIKIHPQTIKQLRKTQSAGTHEEKISAFYELLEDNEVGAIMAARGGNRSLHYLDKIDYSLLDKYPKPLIGSSDFTSILNGAYTCCKNPRKDTFGAMVYSIFLNRNEKDSQEQLTYLKNILAGEKIEYPNKNAKIIKEGKAVGKMLGGTQSVFQAMMGTNFFPDMDNAILFLEDVGEQVSRIDRMFAQLKLSGVLSKISGLVIGNYLLGDETGRKFGFSIEEILIEHTKGLNIPVVMDMDFGHEKYIYPIKYGGKAYLNARENNVKLEF